MCNKEQSINLLFCNQYADDQSKKKNPDNYLFVDKFNMYTIQNLFNYAVMAYDCRCYEDFFKEI